MGAGVSDSLQIALVFAFLGWLLGLYQFMWPGLVCLVFVWHRRIAARTPSLTKAQRYLWHLTQAEPDLAGRFACIAQVGAGGADDERMMRGLLNAVTPEFNRPGRCNSGFARSDSLLVVVLITDEDDVPDQCDGTGMCRTQGSGGSSADWYAELQRHRGGSTDNVVVLSLLGQRLDNTCGAQVAARMIGFARPSTATSSCWPGGFWRRPPETLTTGETCRRWYVHPVMIYYQRSPGMLRVVAVRHHAREPLA